MLSPSTGEQPLPSRDFDYSTPEAQEALRSISALILEVREEHTGPIARKIRLYERTLGLAVIPVLLRRALIVLVRKFGQRSRVV